MNLWPGLPAFPQTCYGNAHVPQARARHDWSILPRAPSSHDPETICLGQGELVVGHIAEEGVRNRLQRR